MKKSDKKLLAEITASGTKELLKAIEKWDMTIPTDEEKNNIVYKIYKKMENELRKALRKRSKKVTQ